MVAALAGQSAASAAEPPMAEVGAPIGDAAPASVFAPTTFRATFRVPRVDTALYIGTLWPVRDVRVTIVGPGPRRQTIVGDTSLPGHMLGLRLPGDAWQADRIELAASTVSAAAPPYLLRAEKLAYIAWRNWWWSAFCGLFLGLAAVQGLLAIVLRSRALGWYAFAMLMEAVLTLAWLGIVRPPPEISQPLNAVVQSLQISALLMFSLLYLERARIPRAATIGLWTIVALNFTSAIGSDLYQDLWPVPDVATRVLILAMGLGFVLLGVAGLRRKVDGSIYYLTGAALAVFGLYVGSFADYLWRPLVEAAPMIGSAIEALLLALAVSLQLRRQEREREHLDRLAHVDGLTGIANRTALDAQLARSWERARRMSEPLGGLMIDVDHFKRYNDTYGHQAGDEVLRRIASVLSDLSVRRDDIVARYGGEEFFVVLAATDLAGAQRVADRLLEAIKALALAHATTQEQRVTVSIGVASIVPAVATDERELIRRADAALYAAKAMGRNRLALDEAIVA
jgi:diguanylate cyclase (GGDEF)-like protein